MTFEHGLFFSYRHNPDMTPYRRLHDHLEQELNDYAGMRVYRDEDRLKSGVDFTDELAVNLCRSVCMIVLYVPTYFESPFCCREFVRMRELEQRRLAALPLAERRNKLIIPVLIKGALDAGSPLAGRQHHDFRNFGLGGFQLDWNVDYRKQLQDIANRVRDRRDAFLREFEKSGADPCADCDACELPPENDPSVLEVLRPSVRTFRRVA